jgi:hypothetical protein
MLLFIGGLLSLVGVVWIIVLAFQNGDPVWGIVSIFCGLAALIYGIMHFDEAKAPVGLMVVGMILGFVGRLMQIE